MTHKQTDKEHGCLTAREAGGNVASQGDHSRACQPFNSPRDAWISDNLPKESYTDAWDDMRFAEQIDRPILHHPDLRAAREDDYMLNRFEKNGLERATYWICLAAMIATALVFIS